MYKALNRAAIKVTQDILDLFNLFQIRKDKMISVRAIPKAEEHGFIGVRIYVGDFCMGQVTVDTYNNQIKDNKIALQYLSTRINKLFDANVDFYGKHI